MTVRILRGDCRDLLKTLPDESVHCVVTSPPYWGLRDYGIPPSLWGGDATCEHSFGALGKRHRGGPPGDGDALRGRDQSARATTADVLTGQTCTRCGAWRGCLGLEPTPQMFVEHIVEVFRDVRRVLRTDGTLWLNLGDSYATGAGKVGDHPGGGEQGARWIGDASRHRDSRRRDAGRPHVNGRGEPQSVPTKNTVGPMTQPNRMPIQGLKPKDLVMVPARVALALQADGWWVRQDIIWSKPNPMPESVSDRCTKSHEYLFLLSKAERYYFDNEAIAEPVSQGTVARFFEQEDRIGHQAGSDRVPGKTNGPMKAVVKKSGNKVRKPASARGVPADTDGKSAGAVACSVPWEGSTRNKRSVWTVTTVPFKEAHFATFPTKLIEPCILAGSPRGGMVLDPFGGAGTTGLVADRHGRDAVLIEMNPTYAAIADKRIRGDAPLFAEVTA